MPIVLGIAGHSGAGKTTLIEALLPRLATRGWRVGVLKHDAHRLDLDREGKDTARFFTAGAAAICAHDPTQSFVRTRSSGPVALTDVLTDLPGDLDLVLVEGHKDAAMPKLVLAHAEPRAAIEGPEVLATLGWNADRLEAAEQLVVAFVDRAWRERPVGTAIFVGGKSRRMGLPKAMLDLSGRTLVEHVLAQLAPRGGPIVLVGEGPLPSAVRDQVQLLPDAADAEGPLAGLLALLRHDPVRAWLVVGCDQPRLGLGHARWLVSGRRPGAWIVLPYLAGRSRPDPFGAVYEPMLRSVLERARARRAWALHQALRGAPLAAVVPPEELAAGWESVNTPEQWRELTGESPRLRDR